MTPAPDRRTRSFTDQLLLWLAPVSLLLNAYFLREQSDDLRAMRNDVAQLKVQVAVLQAVTPQSPKPNEAH